ncbi:hypothetical protein, partial [Pseudoflavonifractor phocaeensis]|uniref:hypothetical protein n=1 Tax=Pseudoflavonifractor phocaeensis TaxID=1870988 RepID=UPI001F45E633
GQGFHGAPPQVGRPAGRKFEDAKRQRISARADSFRPRIEKNGYPQNQRFCGRSLARIKSMSEENGVEFVD